MRRDSKLVRGLVDWLLGGVTARLDFIEQDVKSLQQQGEQIEQNQRVIARTVASQQAQLQQQAQQMVAMRKMHALLAEKVNHEFPGRPCEVCGGPMVFRREASRNAYSLRCPNECGKTLILPETLLLNSIQAPPDSDPQIPAK